MSELNSQNRRRNPRFKRNRNGSFVVFVAIILIVVGLLLWVGYRFFWMSDSNDGPQPMMASVELGEFVSQVLDQGEIQSAENYEIRCQVGSRNGAIEVIDVVDEATMVKGGDFLVQLDAQAFEKELEQQQISVTNSKTAVISAKTRLDAATAAKNEYLEGIFQERLRGIQNEIYDATQERDQSNANLEHNLKLHARSYINNTQLNAYEVAVQRAENSLSLAKQKLHVLENITKAKEVLVFDGDIETAKIGYENELATQKIEEQKLTDILKEIENCRIVVPPGVTGEVVYHKEFDRRGGSDWVLEPGAQVRERQVLIKLPDRGKMEVKALINEQSITLIKPGMPCNIKVDALNNTTLTGVVTMINRTAESAGFMASSVREYAAFIRIINPPDNLIPGMNASVNIQTQYEENALIAPIQCTYAAGDKNYVLRKNGDAYETVEIEIGGDNTQVIWIKSGVKEGDQLALNPGAYKELMDLPEVRLENRIDIPDSASDILNKSKAKTPPADSLTSTEGEDQGERGEGRGEGRGERGKGRGEGGRGEGGGGEGRGPGGGGPGGGFNIDAMIDGSMDRYDTNANGTIDQDELEAVDGRMRDRIVDADSDGDGAISREELKAGMEAMMRQFQNSGGGGGGGFGRGGDGGGGGGGEQ